jgi:tetratricopeptide (TPR) repeat protein
MLRIVAAVSLVLVSWAVLADDKGDCLDSKNHDLRIKGCSAIILTNPKDVVAYHNRGDAYGLKGDIDRAISDYNKAIELNPNYAPAYNSRGRAYTSKGDYTRAVADVTKAGELTPKLVPKPGPLSTAMKGAAHKSKEGYTTKPGPVAGKPGLLPPAGMVAPHKSKVAKPGLVAPKQEALQTVGKAAPHKSNDPPQAGVAVSGKAPAVEPAWAQRQLNNSHSGN